MVRKEKEPVGQKYHLQLVLCESCTYSTSHVACDTSANKIATYGLPPDNLIKIVDKKFMWGD